MNYTFMNVTSITGVTCDHKSFQQSVDIPCELDYISVEMQMRSGLSTDLMAK